MNMLVAILMAAGTLVPSLAPQSERDELRRVAPGYEDWSPIALSGRVEPVDNRATLFAEDVYEGERPGRFGSSERVYMRMYGGIVAVFPRSSYVPTGHGAAAVVPPGTVFHLGSPEEAMGRATGEQRPAAAPLRPGQVSLRQDLAADAAGRREMAGPAPRGGPPTVAADRGEGEAVEPPSIFTSEAYRQRRMAALLAQAARAERAGR